MTSNGSQGVGPKPVLVLSYWNLNESSFGGARRIDALMEVFGNRLILVQPAPAHPVKPSETYAPDFGRRKRGINWGMFNFLFPTTWLRVRRSIRRHQPCLVVATSVWAFAPLAGLANRPPVVLDAHDVLGNAIEERFGPRHLFTRLVRYFERRALAIAAHVFACSDLDRAQFIERYQVPPHKVTTVPNGVDMAVWSPGTPASPLPEASALAGRTVLFFMGKLDYQPNREALAFLVDRLMPALESRAPGRFRLLVVGGPRPAENSGLVVYTGRVPSVEPYVHRADICLAPIFTGSGTRLKILEYLAAGKPVVATPKGAEGIAGSSGTHFSLAKADAFVEAVLELADQPARARAMGEAGRQLVSEQYDWKAIREKWAGVMAAWL